MDGGMKFKTEYYKECFEKGLEFQDYVCKVLIKKLGIPLSSLSSEKYQYSVGENMQGFEIKFDDKFKTTNNIYIETKEKSHPDNVNYVNSGIYRDDNTWIYIIGNYETLYVFSKKHLVLMHQSKKFKEVKTKTSIGFLIGKKDAIKYSIKIIENE